MPNTKKPAETKTPTETRVSRREVLSGAVKAVGAGLAAGISTQTSLAQTDTTRVQGLTGSAVGERSPFEQPQRDTGPPTGNTSSRTPHQDLQGIITPSDLHYERHHGGVPSIDPATYSLLVHGMVDRPLVFSLADLKRMPSVSRILFLECSGNFARNAPEETPAQRVCGLTSTSEWTGVLLSTLFKEVGVRPEAKWFLAEAQDAAVMTRSIPLEKGWDDAMIAYGQNGEAVRPENGYPARLLCPGWEGNASVKWLRRIELSDRPFMTREETAKYTDSIKGDKALQFTFVMEARSIITSPSYPQHIVPGWNEIRGLAWTGRGRITHAELSFDEGASWQSAELQAPVLPLAHTRFRHMWNWDGKETTILSRATDETGYVQPTLRQFIDAKGPGAGPYHTNPITGWRIRPDGSVVFRTEAWV